MKNKSLRNSLLILFIIPLVLVPIYWLITYQPGAHTSLIEERYLANFSAPDLSTFKTGVKRILQRKPREALDLLLGQFLDRSYQQDLEAAATEQFPFRIPLIQLSRLMDVGMIELAYSPLPDPVIPAAMNSGIYVTRDRSRLIAAPDTFDEKIRKRTDEHIRNLETLIGDHPDIHFYVFHLQRLVDSPFHPLNSIFPNSDRGQDFAYFQANKPDGLTVSAMTFSSEEELLENYFRTDHHWNIHGIRQAYEIIYQMLKEKHPDLSPMLDLSHIEAIPGISFWGSYARETLYPIAGEPFEFAQVALPSLEITTRKNTFSFNLFGEGDFGEISNEKFSDYYSAVFGGKRPLTVYRNENGPTRNLLIIGSSFGGPLAPFLAVHFHNTYFVDLREWPDFSLSEFTASHPIDDLLIVANDYVLYREDWLIKP